jgi:hypothetical protein
VTRNTNKNGGERRDKKGKRERKEELRSERNEDGN